jgi:uncharacterized protein YbjT (DUF2867 family)
MAVRRVLVLGATGPTGRLVVEQALAKGLEVTALARHPDRLAPQAGRLRVVAGDARSDAAEVRGAYANQDLLRDVYADKTVGERAITTSDLDWTIVYPTGLTNGPQTGRVRVGERLALSGFPRVSRADVAAVLLQQLEDPRFVRKGVLVAN